jgi:hypothetical protein
VSRSDPKTAVHSSNGRLDVTMVEPRSYRWLKTSNRSSAPVGDSYKRRRENPSRKRPERPAVAGVKIRQQKAFVGNRQGLGDEGRGALC